MSEKDDEQDEKKPKGLVEQARDLAKKAIIKAEQLITSVTSSLPVPGERERAPDLPEPRRAAGVSSSPAGPLSPEPTSPSPALAPFHPPPAQAHPGHPPAPPRDEPRLPEEPMGMLDLEEPPEIYGVDEVALMPRDPHTLFVYWEVTGDGWNRARAALGGDGRLTLRLFVVTRHPERGVETATRDLALGWDHGRMYLPAPEAGAMVSAAVGLLAGDGRFAPIAHSPRAQLPPAEPSAETWVEWLDVPPARARGARPEPPAPRVLKPGEPAPKVPPGWTAPGERPTGVAPGEPGGFSSSERWRRS